MIKIKNWKALLLSEMVARIKEYSHANWDGDEARPITPKAYALALSFVDALPHDLPCPRLLVDPGGFFAFEWHQGYWRTMVVTVTSDSLIFSALLDKETAKSDCGEVPFSGDIPDRVLELLLEINKKSSS